MRNINFFRLLSFCALIILIVGCGVKAQTYVMTRDRSDLESNGNGGFLSGSGEVDKPIRKTRKVYVMEITRAVPESEVKKYVQETTTQTSESIERPFVSEPARISSEMAQQRTIVIPSFDNELSSFKDEGLTVETEYTIEKDDTLQKIAYKHYGSYSKWIKIYEANKDKIKNPNLLRAGTKIILPALQKESH